MDQERTGSSRTRPADFCGRLCQNFWKQGQLVTEIVKKSRERFFNRDTISTKEARCAFAASLNRKNEGYDDRCIRVLKIVEFVKMLKIVDFGCSSVFVKMLKIVNYWRRICYRNFPSKLTQTHKCVCVVWHGISSIWEANTARSPVAVIGRICYFKPQILRYCKKNRLPCDGFSPSRSFGTWDCGGWPGVVFVASNTEVMQPKNSSVDHGHTNFA